MTAMGPVVKEALTTSQMQLSAQWQIREEALKAEIKVGQEKTLKRVAAMVTQGTEVMLDDAQGQVQDDTDDESDEEEASSLVRAKKQRMKPSTTQKKMWLDARHMSEEFNQDDWKNVSVKRLLKDYSEHPEAKIFKCHESDGEVSLKYDSMKVRDKVCKELEAICGSVGAAGTLLAEQIDQVNSAAKKASKAFAAPLDSEQDAAVKALEFCEDIKVILKLWEFESKLSHNCRVLPRHWCCCPMTWSSLLLLVSTSLFRKEEKTSSTQWTMVLGRRQGRS